MTALNTSVELTFAPGQITGCQASYQATNTYGETCEALAGAIYPNVNFETIGQSATRIGFLARSARVMLVPAGQGCTVIKSEVIK